MRTKIYVFTFFMLSPYILKTMQNLRNVYNVFSGNAAGSPGPEYE